MVVDRLHNVVSFKQAKWMKPYIAGNNKLRKAAKNDFEKDFFKLVKNAVFWQDHGEREKPNEPPPKD